MSKVAVINVPYKLCKSKEGAASLHIGHSIAILREECKVVEQVDYIDYNTEEFFAFSGLMIEYVTKNMDTYFAGFHKYEAIEAISRIILERMMGIERGVASYLGLSKEDVNKLVEAAYYGFLPQIEKIKLGGYDSLILFAAKNTSLLFVFTKLIQECRENADVIVIDQYTFEPVTPYLQAVYTCCDISGNNVEAFQKYDLLMPVLKRHMHEMIDTIVIGEGYDYLRKRFDSEKKILDAQQESDVKKRKECEIFHSQRIELDALPYPDYSDMRHIYEFADIEFQRGCNFACVFCERTRMMGNEVKRHTPEYVVGMIKHIMSYGFRKFTVIDCAMNNNQQYTIDILRAIEREELDIEYQGNLRTQETSDELIGLLKRTGCKVIALGIESADEAVLKSMNKQQNLSRMVSLLKKLSNSDIALMLFLIIGFPTETLSAIEPTIELLKQIKRYANIEIIEIEFYHAGHIQKLQPNVYKQYGIEWKDVFSGSNILDSSFNFFAPGVFGAAFYEKGMSRAELVKASQLYLKGMNENEIKLGMIN